MNVTGTEHMEQLGESFGRLLRGGEVCELIGDVGAGKTTFTKGLARGLGVHETVQSPTFTISREYDGRDGLRLVHYDFYRLDDAGIMSDELRETLSDSRTVTVIEWADTVNAVVPAGRIAIYITLDEVDEQQRVVRVESSDPAMRKIIQEVADDFTD